MLVNKKSYKPMFTDPKAAGHMQGIITNKKLTAVKAKFCTL